MVFVYTPAGYQSMIGISANKMTVEPVKIFLAGSIEMGAAEDWQSTITPALAALDKDVWLYNPRRPDWDSSWKQEQPNLQFNRQVNWELNHLDKSDIIFMYFSPDTKSPISLLELGLYAAKGNMIVCCPDGFWRKGNVEIVCTRYNIPFFHTMRDAVGALITKVNSK